MQLSDEILEAEQAVTAKNPEISAEERRRIAGFFALLLEVDRRLHPKQYQRTQQKRIKTERFPPVILLRE